MWAGLFIVFFSVGRDLSIFTHLKKLIIREGKNEDFGGRVWNHERKMFVREGF